MSKFFTQTGDDGFTGYLGEGRLPKDHPLIEAIGALDEASAALGLARSLCQAATTGEVLRQVQIDLYQLMTEISASQIESSKFKPMQPGRVTWLEEQIFDLQEVVESPGEFILPGDSHSGAALALARTIVRRAERRVVGLVREGLVENENVMRYLNRLSSLCFVLELLENGASGVKSTSRAKGR